MAKVFAMSARELDRAEVMLRVREKRMKKRNAALLLGLSERQFRRLYKRYVILGPPGLVSGKRGRPSNRKIAEALKERSRSAVRERYADFGPTLACEKLRELHDIRVSVETLRK